MRALLKILALFLFAIMVSCAGARGNLRFDELKYPVSMSPALYDKDNTVVFYKRELKPVGKLDYTKTIWSTLWTAVTFNPSQELGGPINTQIEENGGEGVVNMTVHVRNCSLNYIPILAWLPIWPGCTVVNIEGDVVKRNDG